MALSGIVFACVAAVAVLSGQVTAQANYFPDQQNVYHLFTRTNPTVSQPLLLGVSGLLTANFNPGRPTVLLLHGWRSGPTSDFIVAFVPNILAVADVNVIAVDWSAGAYLPDYHGVVSDNVPLSAASVARFITWINLETGATLSQYSIFGFEVSAHQAGLIGRNLGGQLPYIYAVNPPREGWEEEDLFRPTDALYTEAIHTDVLGSGMLAPVADVDVYPNGGGSQPGCHILDWHCSQDRSYEYVAESIRSGGFTSTRCATTDEATEGTCSSDETIQLGGLTPKTGVSGIYTVATNEQAPFSRG